MRAIFAHMADCISGLKAVMDDAKSPALMDEFHAVSLAIAQSQRQQLLLRDYGSATTKPIVGGSDLMAHCFTDYLKKRACLLEISNTRYTLILLKDVCVYMDWTVQNYAMIMGHTPNVAKLVGELHENTLPGLKTHLQNACGLSRDVVEAGLALHATALARSRGAGVEILLPIPPQEWQKTAVCPLAAPTA